MKKIARLIDFGLHMLFCAKCADGVTPHYLSFDHSVRRRFGLWLISEQRGWDRLNARR